MSSYVADLEVAVLACGDQPCWVVALCLACHVVDMVGAGGAAGELELAAVPVTFEDGAPGAAPLAGGA